jgi:hypothetical protein
MQRLLDTMQCYVMRCEERKQSGKRNARQHTHPECVCEVEYKVLVVLEHGPPVTE